MTTSNRSDPSLAEHAVTPSMNFEERFFSGRELFGDDFDAQAIDAWFADEEHGYAELYGPDTKRRDYGYTMLNQYQGYARLDGARRYSHVLGFGSNFGDELLPILHRADRVTLLDSSDRYVIDSLQNLPVSYLLAQPSGQIALEDASVDLITCFGVIHHIPNVSTVLAEFGRVMAPGGTLLLREPTISMGDWRRPRLGLTARERGIPRDLLLGIIENSGFDIVRAAPCQFSPWVRLCGMFGVSTGSSWTATAIDSAFSRLFEPLWSYHRRNLLSKFAPASVFVIARRTGSPNRGVSERRRAATR